MKILTTYALRFFIIIIGFSSFLSIPLLVNQESETPLLQMWYKQMSTIIYSLIDTQSLYVIGDWFNTGTFDRYMYTMGLFVCSTLFVILFSIILVFLFYISTPALKKQFRRFLSFSESTPDLFVILLFITLVIFLYKTTGLKILQLYGFNAEPIVIPIIVISYLPIAFFTDYLVQLLEEEKYKDYIILAQAKGLSQRAVFFKHILKNMISLSIPYIRKIMFIILSSIVLIENILKIQGFTSDLFRIFSIHPLMVAFQFFLFAMPVILLEVVGRVLVGKSKGVTSL